MFDTLLICASLIFQDRFQDGKWAQITDRVTDLINNDRHADAYFRERIYQFKIALRHKAYIE